jgi:hypothetical protein
MIRIQIPLDYSACNIREAHISNATYFGSHFEVMLCVDGRNILLVFGKRRQGGFIYFPQFEEGINISQHQSDRQVLEKMLDLFDEGTSTAIMAAVNLFQKLEGGQKWCRIKPKKPERIQGRQSGIPF